jgi:hypothetical protein
MRCAFRLALVLVFALAGSAPAQQTIEIDAQAPTTPFPHFWEQMFGSGRANLTLRESYRDDLRAVKKVADSRYVRFHAILHDENGVFNLDDHGNPFITLRMLTRSTTGYSRTACDHSSKSASCPRNSRSILTTSMPSGISRMFHRRRA